MRRPAMSLILISLLSLAGCDWQGRQPTPEETTLTAVGQAAPAFAVTTLEGDRIDLEQSRGSVVLVNFFATWCPPCREEMPHLERDVWERFQNDDFTMVAVGREHTDDELKPFVEEAGISFPVAADPERQVYALYADQYIPRNVVIGRAGRIIFQSSGFEEDEFLAMIEAIAAELAAQPYPMDSATAPSAG